MNHLNDSLPTPDPSDSAAQLAAALAPAAAAGHFDELRGASVADAPGAATASATPKSIANKPDITGAWAQFFDQLGPEGFQDLDRRMQSLQRQVRDNGITYNVYADSRTVHYIVCNFPPSDVEEPVFFKGKLNTAFFAYTLF